MEFEAVTPAHRAFSVFGQPRENLVQVSPDVVAHGNHSAVHKRDAGTFSESVQFHEKHHQKEYPRHQFNKAVVGNRIRKIALQAPLDTIEIVVLERAVRSEMVAHQNGHYLAFGHPARTVPMSYAALSNRRQTQSF